MTVLPGREALEMTADPAVRRRDRAEIGALVGAAIGSVPLVLAWVVLSQQLAQVDPSQDSAGITRDGDPLEVGTVVAVLGAVVVVLLYAGLPRLGRSALGTTRGAVAQGIGGVVVGLEAFLVSQLHFYFTVQATAAPTRGAGRSISSPPRWPLRESSPGSRCS